MLAVDYRCGRRFGAWQGVDRIFWSVRTLFGFSARETERVFVTCETNRVRVHIRSAKLRQRNRSQQFKSFEMAADPFVTPAIL